MTERLPFHFSLSCIGEGNGDPLQCSCLESPRDGGAWWAAVCGVAQGRTRLTWPSSSSMRATLSVSCCPSSRCLGSRDGSFPQSLLRTWHDTDERSSKYLSSDWTLALWAPEQRTVPAENVQNFFSNVAIWNINLITLRPCGSAPRVWAFLIGRRPTGPNTFLLDSSCKTCCKSDHANQGFSYWWWLERAHKSTWWFRGPASVSMLFSTVVWMTDSSQISDYLCFFSVSLGSTTFWNNTCSWW